MRTLLLLGAGFFGGVFVTLVVVALGAALAAVREVPGDD